FQSPPWTRLHYTRLLKWYASFLCLAAVRRTSTFRALVSDFRPEAILTVTHGYSWLSAARIALDHKLPLHLICHDDWTTTVPVCPFLHAWSERVFGKYYRAAASRLCVSPFMVEEY